MLYRYNLASSEFSFNGMLTSIASYCAEKAIIHRRSQQARDFVECGKVFVHSKVILNTMKCIIVYYLLHLNID